MGKGIIIGVIIGVLFIVCIVIGVIVLNQKGVFDDQPKVNITQIELFISAEDTDTRESVNANFIINYLGNDTIISKGEIKKDSFTPILVDSDKVVQVNCWNEDHYLVRATRTFSYEEINSKKARLTCSMVRIGKLEVKANNELKTGTSEITYNIKSIDGWTYRTSGCFRWSPGIIYATIKNNIITCENSFWLNWSSYDSEKKEYIYLPKDMYRCNEELQKCESVSGNRCKLIDLEIPSRFKNKVDGCFSLGKTLSPGEDYNFTIEVKTLDFLNSLDFLDITFFDNDRRYSEIENRFLWVSEQNGQNIGNEDKLFGIEYR